MTEQKSTNVHWHKGDISREDRTQLLGQKGVTLWFTGLSGSGKSTIAVALEKALYQHGKLTYRLDGDNIRLGINKNLGFSAQDRSENIRRIGEIAKLFVDTGVIALSSFVSPYREDRDTVRQLHEEAGMDFIETMIKSESLATIIKKSKSLDFSASSLAEKKEDFLNRAVSIYHPCGTCSLGQNPDQDPVALDFKLRGFQNLWVADASTFPSIPSGNINSAVMMMALKAASSISVQINNKLNKIR